MSVRIAIWSYVWGGTWNNERGCVESREYIGSRREKEENGVSMQIRQCVWEACIG